MLANTLSHAGLDSKAGMLTEGLWGGVRCGGWSNITSLESMASGLKDCGVGVGEGRGGVCSPQC